MKEAGLTPPTTATGTGDHVTQVEVKLVHIFRLDGKWEKFCANVTAKTLDVTAGLLKPIQILIYAAAASLLLVASAKLLQAIKSNDNLSDQSNPDGSK